LFNKSQKNLINPKKV